MHSNYLINAITLLLIDNDYRNKSRICALRNAIWVARKGTIQTSTDVQWAVLWV